MVHLPRFSPKRMIVRGLIIFAIANVGLVGCDKPKTQAKGQSTTTVREHSVIDVGPSTRPTSRPTKSVLMIDGRELEFPAARMVLQQAQPTVDVLLFSDDPPNALSATYSGNRYYFDLKLEISDLDQLAASDMHWKAASIERVDAPDGIFLDGDRRLLQPYDLEVMFNKVGEMYSIEVAGEFLMFGRDENGPPKTVMVRGKLVAELEVKGRKAATTRAAGR